MNFKLSSAISLVFVVLTITSSGCEKEVQDHNTENEIKRLIEDNNLPSLCAAIVSQDSIVWSFYSGYRDILAGKTVDEESIYHIGSISKVFVVTALMQLEEQGRINLDEDVSNYLAIDLRNPIYPEIPITTRMLLTHMAGLAWPKSYNSMNGMWNNFDRDQGPPPLEWVPQYLIPSGISYDRTLWKSAEPGKYEFYSNIGICVAAAIIEKITGQNFREYCRQNIFLPLGMNASSYNYADLNLDQIAFCYENRGRYTEYFDNRIYSSGGAKSTIPDLLKFARCYLNKGRLNSYQMLRDSTVEKILSIENPASGRCLVWEAYHGGWFGHAGALDIGTSTILAIHPENNLAIVLFTNTKSNLVAPGGEAYNLVKQKAHEYMNAE
jgi:CubicO group peptidase (beta-lactamase class C family)